MFLRRNSRTILHSVVIQKTNHVFSPLGGESSMALDTIYSVIKRTTFV